MNSKMTTNTTINNWTKKKTKTKTKQTEQEQNQRNGDQMEGFQWGGGAEGPGIKKRNW